MKKIFILFFLSFSFLHADTPNACDTLVAHPSNKSNPPEIKGVEFEKINAVKAIKACTQASKDFPDEPRYSYQLGRVYYKMKDYKKAFSWYSKSAEQNNTHSQLMLVVMYSDGRGTSINENKAMAWFRKAVKQGFAPALGMMRMTMHASDDYEEFKQDYKKVLDWYTKATGKNSTVARYDLGFMFPEGQEVKEAEAETFKWTMKAAEQNSTLAQYNLGEIYHKGQGVKEDYKEAFKWFMKAAKQGHADAQNMIGDMYYKGKDVEKDYKEAFKWFMKAAEQGHVDAQFILGVMYLEGQGVEKDYKEAFKWYVKAAEQGEVNAQYIISNMYHEGIGVEKDYKEAFKWFMKAAEQGEANAQYMIGDMYHAGQGVEKDYKEAFKWFMKAAEQGIADSQYKIGLMYEHGQWATKNYKKALKWYIKAAEQDNLLAQLRIGFIYSTGKQVKKDYKKAFKWFMKAAEQNNIHAQHNIAFFYINGWGVKKNLKKAFEWYMKIALQGDAGTQAIIGAAYNDGMGVKKNYVKAYAWFSLAITNGNDDARILLNELERKMTPEQIAIAQNHDPLKLENKPTSKSTEHSQTYTGTGFFVDKSTVLTNHHVVKNCNRIELVRKGYKSTAKIKAKDSINDLAILEADKINNSSLNFRAGKGIRIGDDIIVIGYPLGELLGSGIKLTTGNVSALTGLINDTTSMQLTAPVQPGNSGGALLDKSGNVVGVIVARLKKEQNVNLAIKANVAQMFLDINNVDYAVSMSKDKKDVADIADETKASIVQVICYQ